MNNPTHMTNDEIDNELRRLDKEIITESFATFVAYNFRDVDGLVQLDEKFKFIALANQMAHESTVDFQAVLGTVSYVETAIINHAHNVLNKIVHDKNISDHDKVEGAIVMTPKIGLHEWVGSVDINSLYPNTIRSLNISPEMIIGQFTAQEEAWRDIWKGNKNRHTLITESGEQHICTASEWKIILEDRSWAISAYGTVFDQSHGRGVVADILGFWYSERKRLQAEKKRFTKLAKEEKDPLKLAEHKKQEEHYDLLQLTKKISMNSLYGALLNKNFRFGDERMGASVTATGRQITTHMIETLDGLLTGTVNPLIKESSVDKDGKPSHTYRSESEAIIYGDTDSVDGSSIVRSSVGTHTISELFDSLSVKWVDGTKEYSAEPGLLSPCVVDGEIKQKPVKAIYRHRVSKPRWKITLKNGASVVVTDDHSIMVMRDGRMIEVKPSTINCDTDVCITIGNS
jgi:DNA polymerase elongation subunit (family B)